MAEPVPTIDVRDMLCAQALASTDRAMKALASGQTVAVCCNADEVREDLAVWAHGLRHVVLKIESRGNDTWLWIRKAS